MIILLIVLTAVAAYLTIGLRYVAPAYVTREVAKFTAEYPMLAREPRRVERERQFSAGMSLGPALVWPFWLAAVALTARVAARAPLTDFEARQKLDEQARHIADLERQLGMR